MGEYMNLPMLHWHNILSYKSFMADKTGLDAARWHYTLLHYKTGLDVVTLYYAVLHCLAEQQAMVSAHTPVHVQSKSR